MNKYGLWEVDSVKTIDHYIRLLQIGKFKKALPLQPIVDTNKRIWNKYLNEWRDHAKF